MRTPNRKNRRRRRCSLCFALLPLSAFFAAPQPGNPPEPIGRLLTSDPVAIEGRTSWISPSEEYEEPTPQIFSGNKITLQKGIALLQFDDASGMVGFCGRTSLSIIKSKGAPLYALSSGTLSFDVSLSVVIRVLTPEFAVEWKSSSVPGKKQGVVALDANGTLCVQNIAGNVRISNQLSGLSTDVATGSSVQLRSGQTVSPQLLKGLECGCSASFPFPPIPTGLGRGGPSSGAVNTLERSPSVLVTTTDESARQHPPPQPDNPQGSLPERLPRQTTPAPITLSQSTELPPQPDTSTARPPDGAHSMTTATLAASRENMPKPTPKNSFGQKVKNFFRTVFFLKRKNSSPTPPASD